MKKNRLILVLLAIFSVGFISSDTKASFTVATFADPSKNSSNPLFKVDFTSMKLTGGWSDANTGLTLQIPYSGHIFTDAWFNITDVNITTMIPTQWGPFGQLDQGKIRFYADTNNTNPLLIIDFDSGSISPFGFGANDVLFTAANVKITGSEITGPQFSEEVFSFSFANLARLPGSNNWNDGFTTTAAFTSSAIAAEIPEPATICLLTLGELVLFRKKKRS
jgi:hypothetical protein